MNLVEEDGLVIDADTGEILEGVSPGDDYVELIAFRLADAQAQAKQWDAYVGGLKRVLLRHAEEKGERRFTAGGYVARVQQRTTIKTDMDALQETIAEAELTRDELLRLVEAAKGFDEQSLPQSLRLMIEAHQEHITSRPFLVLDVVRRSLRAAS